MTRAVTDHSSTPQETHPTRTGWGFEEGDEIAPGRSALRLLGGGRRYEAYLAFDGGLHAPVVVKILRPALVDDADARSGLEREAGILAGLAHPGLLRCFGADTDGTRPLLVLEFLEGPRLSTLLRRFGPLGPDQLVPLAVGICSALHYLSGAGIVHLDVKPRNVIMGAPPRLIDLSVARTFEEARVLDVPVGTDGYMAPEQRRPRPTGVGPEADVWGLGVTLYEAATGRRPFEGPGRADGVEDGVADLSPEPLGKDVPRPIADAILGCLAPDPVDRPRPVEVAERFEEILAVLPRHPSLGRLRPRPTRW